MLAALLTAVLALSAQDAPPDAAALSAEFEKLQTECNEYSAEFWKTLQPNDQGVITPAPEQFAKFPDKIYGPRFLELGKRAGQTEAGCKALVQALRMVREPPEAQAEIL